MLNKLAANMLLGFGKACRSTIKGSEFIKVQEEHLKLVKGENSSRKTNLATVGIAFMPDPLLMGSKHFGNMGKTWIQFYPIVKVSLKKQ